MKIVLKVIAVLGVIGSMMVGAQAADWVAGEIRRVDAANSKLTIKHEEIKSLDMPPMTMVFYVKDPTLLNGLRPQDKVEFQAMTDGTRHFMTAVRR